MLTYKLIEANIHVLQKAFDTELQYRNITLTLKKNLTNNISEPEIFRVDVWYEQQGSFDRTLHMTAFINSSGKLQEGVHAIPNACFPIFENWIGKMTNN